MCTCITVSHSMPRHREQFRSQNCPSETISNCAVRQVCPAEGGEAAVNGSLDLDMIIKKIKEHQNLEASFLKAIYFNQINKLNVYGLKFHKEILKFCPGRIQRTITIKTIKSVTENNSPVCGQFLKILIIVSKTIITYNFTPTQILQPVSTQLESLTNKIESGLGLRWLKH